MSYRYGPSLITSSYVYGVGGLGIPGSLIPSTGTTGPSAIYPSLSLPADAAKEMRMLMLTNPSGPLFLNEDGSFQYTGPTSSFNARLFADGVAQSPDITVFLSFGATGVIGSVNANSAFSINAGSGGRSVISSANASSVFSLNASTPPHAVIGSVNASSVFSINATGAAQATTGVISSVNASSVFSLNASSGPAADPGFVSFCRTVAGITPTVMPDNDPGFVTAYNQALCWVPMSFKIACSCNGGYGIYNEVVYNLGVSFLIQYQPDQPGQNFFTNARTAYGENNFVPGVISSSSDETTSQTMTVGSALSNLSLFDLQQVKNPFGRAGVMILMTQGPGVWGLS